MNRPESMEFQETPILLKCEEPKSPKVKKAKTPYNYFLAEKIPILMKKDKLKATEGAKVVG